jgi:hypothetical protein
MLPYIHRDTMALSEFCGLHSMKQSKKNVHIERLFSLNVEIWSHKTHMFFELVDYYLDILYYKSDAWIDETLLAAE